MANPEHVKVVRQGAAAIAEWRQQNPAVRLDLSGAGFRKADLAELASAEADLAGADLSEAELTGANLTRADLEGPTSRGQPGRRQPQASGLLPANLSMADLTEANLTKANLMGANLMGALPDGTDFDGARLGCTSLGNCDLSQATGLSAVNHRRPSSIGVDTLIRSFRGAGNRLTPDLETFFLGAGVPKELLAELPRIVGAVEYYSCFISYGQPDLEFRH